MNSASEPAGAPGRVVTTRATPAATVEPAAATAAFDSAQGRHPDVEGIRKEIAAARGERDTIAADLRKAASEVATLRADFDRETAERKNRADQEMWVVRQRLSRVETGALIGGAVAALFMAFLTYEAIAASRANTRLSNELAVATGRASGVGTIADPVQMAPQPVHSAVKVTKAAAQKRALYSRHSAHSTAKATKASARSRRRAPHQPPRTTQTGRQAAPSHA